MKRNTLCDEKLKIYTGEEEGAIQGKVKYRARSPEFRRLLRLLGWHKSFGSAYCLHQKAEVTGTG